MFTYPYATKRGGASYESAAPPSFADASLPRSVRGSASTAHSVRADVLRQTLLLSRAARPAHAPPPCARERSFSSTPGPCRAIPSARRLQAEGAPPACTCGGEEEEDKRKEGGGWRTNGWDEERPRSARRETRNGERKQGGGTIARQKQRRVTLISLANKRKRH